MPRAANRISVGLPAAIRLLAAAPDTIAGEWFRPSIATWWAAGDILWQVLGAVALGVLAGWLGGHALRAGEEHGATDHGSMLLFTVLLALLVLGLSGLLHLDGVLAAFVTGLTFNLTSTGGERTAEVEIDEAINRFAVLPMFVLLGPPSRGLGLPESVIGAGMMIVAASTVAHGLTSSPGRLLYRRLTAKRGTPRQPAQRG